MHINLRVLGRLTKINRALKETLIKLSLESSKGWIGLLPLLWSLAPYIVRNLPTMRLCLEDFPLLPRLRDRHLVELSNHSFLKSLQDLQFSTKAIHWTV